MPIAALFEFPGEDVSGYQQVFDLAGPGVLENQPKRLSHVCYATEGGWAVLDVWEDEASFAAFGEILGPIAVQAGFDPKPQVFPVVGTITQDGVRKSY